MRDLALDSLGRLKQIKWEEKQEAYHEFSEARSNLHIAWVAMREAIDEQKSRREFLNHEFEILKETKLHQREIWKQYEAEKDRLNDEIQPIKFEADQEHQAMVECFEKANKCHDEGDNEQALEFSTKGHQHRAKRNELNSRVRELIGQIHQAKSYAKALTPPIDQSGFNQAREAYEESKKMVRSAEAEFYRLKEIRNQKRETFQIAEVEFFKVKADFERRLEEDRDNSENQIIYFNSTYFE